jgi:4-aminobutyrate--pyruvate transaminase
MRTLTFSHMFGGKTHPAAMELADKMAAMVPVEDAHVFFGSSGSDANDTQVKMIRYWANAIGRPEKHKIIARDKGYHGVTVAARTDRPARQPHALQLPFDALGILRTGSPHYYRDGLPGESEAEFVERAYDELEALISPRAPIRSPRLSPNRSTAPAASSFLLQTTLIDYSRSLISMTLCFGSDEVICGFGRLGT